mmetsp:Transcript_24219/g.25997  ORF Transcript_24219/g.25997 Transcript_24219/m.25997 type:complete len:167 (-) Transcript_24219:64-564(-)
MCQNQTSFGIKSVQRLIEITKQQSCLPSTKKKNKIMRALFRKKTTVVGAKKNQRRKHSSIIVSASLESVSSQLHLKRMILSEKFKTESSVGKVTATTKVYDNNQPLVYHRQERIKEELTIVPCLDTGVVDGCRSRGTFADFIFDGDSEDEDNDQQETLYWAGCQGS